MAFIDLRLPSDISLGAQGGPDWEPISITTLESGDEVRDVVKSKALGNWTISYDARRPAIWQRFQDFWYIVGGNSWPFKDWLDFECAAAQSHLTAIDSTHWQMWKRRTIGSFTYDQKIVLPYNATVNGGGSYSVARATGIITKASGADPTTFATSFDKLCRLVSGHLVQTIDTRKNDAASHNGTRTIIVSYAGIGVKEIPLTSA